MGGAEYLRLFRLWAGLEEEEEDGGARESLRASDNSAMLRLCSGALGDVPRDSFSLFVGTMFSLLLLNAISDTMLGETLQLCVFTPSSALGELLTIGQPMTVDPVDWLREVGVVLVEEGGVKKAGAAKTGPGVGPAAELLGSISDADDIMHSEPPPSCSTLSRFNSKSFLSSPLDFPVFSSVVIILTSSFPLLSSFSLPSISSSSLFVSSKLPSPSSSSWSQIMDASMLLRCSDPGEAAGLREAHPAPDPDLGEPADLNGDVHPNF